jgi:hypothetical protein
MFAQGARRTGGSPAGAAGCVSPLPQQLGAGGLGGGGFGGRGRGARPDSTARPDSSARRRPARGAAAGCPPFFPDSLALTAAQKQQIVALRASFAQAHATELAQLQTIAQNARAARQSGQSADQVRAITAQAQPIRAALNAPEQQVQAQVEATLTPGQLGWMEAHAPPRRGRGARP